MNIYYGGYPPSYQYIYLKKHHTFDINLSMCDLRGLILEGIVYL